ncbi:hypothetical protein CRG98_003430 [Punica granatum]|uniref:Uncharacterized protein n=1 Tax=Punica granatum TaxID=22663 RepID=A0A2I0L6F0_PUNGR|nr:hypothetical protein CRG98_003430 [Punica granatum]
MKPTYTCVKAFSKLLGEFPMWVPNLVPPRSFGLLSIDFDLEPQLYFAVWLWPHRCLKSVDRGTIRSPCCCIRVRLSWGKRKPKKATFGAVIRRQTEREREKERTAVAKAGACY